MKKVSVILFALIFGLATAGFSQTSPGFFEGKWSVLIKGTPEGDAAMPMRFEAKEGKLKGYFTAKGAQTETEMTLVEAKGDELSMAFTVSGYDVSLVITKKDDDHAIGKLMDMFDVEASRVK
jgi:phosphoribosyl-dephospho-CoA transferase